MSFKSLLLMLIFSVVISLANYAYNPVRPPWNPETDLPEGEILYSNLDLSRNRYLWIDARQAAVFSQAHFPGAVNLNPENWDGVIFEVLDQWQPSIKTVVYCSSRACDSSHVVAERLRSEMGLTDVFVLHGGWEILEREIQHLND